MKALWFALVLLLVFVFANTPPITRLVITPTSTVVNAVVTLDGSGTTDPGSPVGPQRWRYDFGDGGFTGGQGRVLAVSHGYATSGTFTATLTVTDNKGLTGKASGVVTVAPGSPTPDTTPPSVPGNVVATSVSSTQISVSWSASTDNVGVTGYRIERCIGTACSTFATLATTTGLSIMDSGLTATTSYSYRVLATDIATNLSPYSNTASATTGTPADTTAPTTPTNLNPSLITQTSMTVTWTASTDASGIAKYEVWMTDVLVQNVTSTTADFIALTCATSYNIAVNAVDTAGNPSTKATLTVSTATCSSGGPPENPTTAIFTASPDHNTVTAEGQALVTSYLLDVIPAAGSLPVTSKDLGKGMPNASNDITYTELQTVLTTVPNGDYIAKVSALGPGGASATTTSNLFSVLNSAPPPPPPGQPYGGVAQSLPGTLQLENFDEGGPGVAFSDTTSGNIGGVYRTTDVDLTPVSDAPGGYAVGWTAETEWTQYTVNVQTTGTYTLGFRVASGGSAGTFHLNVNGVNVTGSMQVPDTGSWQTYTTIFKTGVTLTAGLQTWRLVMDTRNSTTGEIGDFNWISVQ